MEYPSTKRGLFTKLAWLGGFFLVIFLAGYYFGYVGESCGQDGACFNTKLAACKPSSFLNIKNNNVYSYKIANMFGKSCILTITLERTAVGTEPEIVSLLEGKSMRCHVPKKELQQVQVDKVNSILQYCHGELKEGLYALIINRMYTYLIAQLGPIQEQIDQLREV